MASGAPAKRVDAVRALRDAGVTALLTFGLFLPLIGFQTVTDVRNDLILNTRWPLLFAVVALVGFSRLAYSFAIEPWLQNRALKPAVEPAAWRGKVARWIIPFA
ncbi:MAG: DUF3382 domain-containing protein, partial [Pseudolabrys sp.]